MGIGKALPLTLRLGVAIGLVIVCVSCARSGPSGPVYAPDGTVHAPAFDLPPSDLLSEEAVERLKRRAAIPRGQPVSLAEPDIEQVRASMEAGVLPLIETMKQRYPVQITDRTIDGVPTRVFVPRDEAVDESRVLINLHGGGFTGCAEACALMESIPIASVGKMKVISVDYRQGPEHVFPAASEDVATVYRSLLADYEPSDIGIYGCSAGGSLAAQSVAWMQNEKLPRPGAIGIFSASAGRFARGDSAHVAARIDGSFPPPPPAGTKRPPSAIRSYFEGADPEDPLVSPLVSPSVLARFPPTLVITGTRATDLSGAVYTHTQLAKAGVDGDLIVAEALGHCFLYDSDLPEARDVYDLIIRFFDKHLGKVDTARH